MYQFIKAMMHQSFVSFALKLISFKFCIILLVLGNYQDFVLVQCDHVKYRRTAVEMSGLWLPPS